MLPLSNWIGQVDSNGQPKNAVTVMYVFGAAILCTILPSQVAFTSLVSAGGVPTIAAYGLIALLRLTMTPGRFKSSHFYLGRLAIPFYIISTLFNALVFSVCRFSLNIDLILIPYRMFQVMISPFVFPVTAQNFNFVSLAYLVSFGM